MSPLQNKIKGVFFGQAIGDALGLATEFLTKAEVAQHYPHGVQTYADIVQDKHRSRWTRGDWTDDTDQWLCILDSYLTLGKVEPLDIAQRLYQWMVSGGMGIGISTYRVMSLPQYTQFPYKGSELVWKMKGQDLAPNGALMRNSIVCLIDQTDLDVVLENCDHIARLTHHDQRCVDSCRIMAHIIHGELVGAPISLLEIEDVVKRYDPRIHDYIFPLSPDISDLALDDPKALGYTLKALAAGLWAYYFATNFEDGLINIIHEGGDADTNGCIAGSLLGAKFGFGAIATHLIEGLNKKTELDAYVDRFLRMS